MTSSYQVQAFKQLEIEYKSYQLNAEKTISEKTQLAKDLEEILHHHQYEKDFLLEFKEKCKLLNLENEKLQMEISKLKSLKEDNELLKEKLSIEVKSLISDVNEFNILELPLESLKIGAKNILNFTSQEMEKGFTLDEACKNNNRFNSLLEHEIIFPIIEILKNSMRKSWIYSVMSSENHPWKMILSIKDEVVQNLVDQTNKKIGNQYNDDLHLEVFLKFSFKCTKISHFWKVFGENKDLITQSYESQSLLSNKKNIEIIKKILHVISKLPFEFE